MMIQSFEIIQKPVFNRSLEAHMGMKGWFARVGLARDLLSDLRVLQNRRHFGSTMLWTKCTKRRFLQFKYNSNSIF
jgi:hypothetical protein